MATEYPRDARLAPIAVYALPFELVDAIEQCCRGVFTADELQFERRLASLSGGGFFAQQPLIYPGLELAQPENDDIRLRKANIERQQRENGLKIDQLAVEMIVKDGGKAAHYAEYQQALESSRQAIHQRRVAYAAWLATERTFRAERDALRTRWATDIAARRRFPSVPISLLCESPQRPPAAESDLVAEFRHFYLRWGLETLATWELPVPMQTQALTPNFYHSPAVGSAGLTLFVPWFMFRDQELKLRDLATQQMYFHRPAAFAGWLDRAETSLGYDRYEKMLKLYVWYELALQVRYEDRLAGNVERLDRAFAVHLYGAAEKSSESVKKLRLELQRRLSAASDTSDEL
jgi:hypothetical protein